MSEFQTYSYPGWGEWAKENLHYSQAVRVGDRIHCSGQGGWMAEKKEVDLDSVIVPGLGNEIDQAFRNVEYNLKHAGGKGFSQVYKVVTYSIDIRAQHEHIVRNLRKYFGNHCPIWTELGVKQLGADDMHFEIDVEAFDPQGAKEAAKA